MEAERITTGKAGIHDDVYRQLTLLECLLIEKLYINTKDSSMQIIIDNCELDTVELNCESWISGSYYLRVKVTNSVFHEDFDIISDRRGAIFMVLFIDCSIGNSIMVVGRFSRHRNWGFIAVNFFKELVLVPRVSSIYITNCTFIKDYLVIRGEAIVSLKYNKLSNTTLNCSDVSLQVVDYSINEMNINKARKVDIRGSAFIRSHVRITGNYWERSNAVLKINIFKNLHCKQISLKIAGSSVGNMKIFKAGNVNITGCIFTGRVVTITRETCCSKITLQNTTLNNTDLVCKMVSLEVFGSSVGNMQISEAGNVIIKDSSGGFAEIEGTAAKKCCSDITVTNSTLSQTGLDCKKASLKMVDSIVSRVIWKSYNGSRFIALDTAIETTTMTAGFITLLSVTKNKSVLQNVQLFCPMKLNQITGKDQLRILCVGCNQDEYKVSITFDLFTQSKK